jgi:hypothetical protein
MVTFSINFPVLLPVLLVLIIFIGLGIAFALWGAFASAGRVLLFALAGGDGAQNGGGARGPKNALIIVRFAIYLIVCIAAIYLSIFGHQALAYLAAVFGGFAYGAALIKLIK